MTNAEISNAFDATETPSRDSFDAASLVQLDAFARAGIANLKRQDGSGETGGEGTTAAWYASAAQAGDMVCCRIIEWADEYLGGSQDVYDAS